MDNVSKFPALSTPGKNDGNFLRCCFRKRKRGMFPSFQRRRQIQTFTETGQAYARVRIQLPLVTWKDIRKVAVFCGGKVTTPHGNPLETWKLRPSPISAGELNASRPHARRSDITLQCCENGMGQGSAQRSVGKVHMARKAIRRLAQHLPIAGEHARWNASGRSLRLNIDRAMERLPGIHTEGQAIAALDTPATRCAARIGAKYVRVGTGERIVIEKGNVVTVLPRDARIREMGERGDRRRKDVRRDRIEREMGV